LRERIVLKGVALVLVGALTGSACGGESAETPPPEAAPAPEGVFGSAPSAVAGTPSVLTLRPAGDGVTLPPRENPRMDQLGLAFNPGLLLVRAGETVSFANSETIAHNVTVAFSDNDSTVLDYETDPAGHVDLLIEREGGYEVTCQLHPGMRAFIYATTAPYATFAQNNGAFRIEGVPPGSYTMEVWSVDPALRSERTIEVTGPTTEIDLGPS
jgi:plastocyanin